jgi:hypothetical protein
LIQPGEQEVISGSLPPFFDTLNELVGFFHDGKIGGEIGIEDFLKAYSAQSGNHFASDVGTYRQSEALAERGAYGRSGIDDNILGRVAARAAQTLSVSSFSCSAPVGQATMHCPQETHGTSAEIFVERAADMGIEAAVVRADDRTACCFSQAAVQRRQRTHLPLSRTMTPVSVVHNVLRQSPCIIILESVTAEVFRQLLELAVPLRTQERHSLVMIGKNQLQGLSCVLLTSFGEFGRLPCPR